MGKYYTYISKKQIGVVYFNNKKGNLSLSDEIISWLYNSIAEIKNFNNDHSFENVLDIVKNAIDKLFENDYEEADKDIKRAFHSYNVIFQKR